MSAGLASACHSEGNVLVHNLGTALCNTAGPGERISFLPSSLRFYCSQTKHHQAPRLPWQSVPSLMDEGSLCLGLFNNCSTFLGAEGKKQFLSQ